MCCCVPDHEHSRDLKRHQEPLERIITIYPFTIYSLTRQRIKTWTRSNPTDIFHQVPRPLISNCDIDHKRCAVHPRVCFVSCCSSWSVRWFLFFFYNVHSRASGDLDDKNLWHFGVSVTTKRWVRMKYATGWDGERERERGNIDTHDCSLQGWPLQLWWCWTAGEGNRDCTLLLNVFDPECMLKSRSLQTISCWTVITVAVKYNKAAS